MRCPAPGVILALPAIFCTRHRGCRRHPAIFAESKDLVALAELSRQKPGLRQEGQPVQWSFKIERSWER